MNVNEIIQCIALAIFLIWLSKLIFGEEFDKQLMNVNEIIQCIALAIFLIWLSKLTFGGN